MDHLLHIDTKGWDWDQLQAFNILLTHARDALITKVAKASDVVVQQHFTNRLTDVSLLQIETKQRMERLQREERAA